MWQCDGRLRWFLRRKQRPSCTTDLSGRLGRHGSTVKVNRKHGSPFAILAGMKNVLVVLTIAISGVIAFSATGQAGPDARARELIQTLHLRVLPRESGYLGIIGASEQTT